MVTGKELSSGPSFMRLPFLMCCSLRGRHRLRACFPVCLSAAGAAGALQPVSPCTGVHAPWQQRTQRRKGPCGHGGVWLQDGWSRIILTPIPACWIVGSHPLSGFPPVVLGQLLPQPGHSVLLGLHGIPVHPPVFLGYPRHPPSLSFLLE